MSVWELIVNLVEQVQQFYNKATVPVYIADQEGRVFHIEGLSNDNDHAEIHIVIGTRVKRHV